MLALLFILLVSFVVFDALADATRDDKKKISHLLQSLFILNAFVIAIYYPGITWKDHIMILLLWYGVNRLFLFDIIYNMKRGLTLDYIGRTGYWDILISNILYKIKMPLFFWLWIKFIIWIAYNGAILSQYKL